jgi:hypothetical protein
MKIRTSLLSTSIACFFVVVSGCSSVPQGDIESRAAELRVYKTAELTGTNYESVGHVWVDSWRAAFYPPTYPTEDEAVRSLRAEAARLGANGIVNVVCLDQNVPKKSSTAEAAILCYANAIRVPRS